MRPIRMIKRRLSIIFTTFCQRNDVCMKKKNAINDQLSLRKRAEEKLSKQSELIETLSRQDIKSLVHELGHLPDRTRDPERGPRTAQEHLETSRRKYSDLYNFAPVGYFTLDPGLLIRELNFTGAMMLGTEKNGLLNRPFVTHVAKSDRQSFLSHFQEERSKADRNTGEFRMRRKDGSEFHAVLESVSETSGWISLAVIDVSDRKSAETAVRRQAELLNLTRDTIIVRNMEDTIIFWNQGAADAYGWQSSEAEGRISHRLLKTRFPEPYGKIMDAVLKTGSWKGELSHTRRDGSVLVVSSRWTLQRGEAGDPVAIMEINSDITEKKKLEDAIRFQAYHDSLTDLPNRRLFMDHLSREINHVKRKNELLGVLFLDLDKFKIINDTLGHSTGDRILQAVSKRLKDRMRESDIIARMGGDEFAIVVTSINHPEDASRIADKVLAAFLDSISWTTGSSAWA